ncbi:MAG: hypothetical protein GY722_26540, partial [bacterium]|nr:hypothetical protein [bacterium]
MNTEFQGRVLEIFDESLQQAAGARSSFIKEACAGNTALIGEVESLL